MFFILGEKQPPTSINTSPPMIYISSASNSVPILVGTKPDIGSPWKQSSEVTGTAFAASATLSASSVLLPQQLMQTSSNLKLVQNVSSVPQIQTKGSQELPQSEELIRPSSYVDAEGYRIWICPACGKVDDGSAMIGCDGCDAWYHW